MRFAKFVVFLLAILTLTGGTPSGRRVVGSGGEPHTRHRGQGSSSNSDVTAPSAISDLTATVITENSVTFTWTAPGDDAVTGRASSYDMRYNTVLLFSGNFSSSPQVLGEIFPAVAGTTETMTVNGLTPDTDYYFAIKTLDEKPNTSAISNILFITTAAGPDVTPPRNITDLVAFNPTQTTITLSWTAPGDNDADGTAASYDVRYSTSPITAGNFASAPQFAQSMVPQLVESGETLIITGLTASTIYYFALTATDAAGNTNEPSNVVLMSTLPVPPPVDTTPPAAVTNLSASVLYATAIQLVWTAPGDDGNVGQATSYDLRRSTSTITSGNFSAATQVSGPTPGPAGATDTYLVSGLSASTTYYFALKTTDEVGNTSLISNVLSAATTSTPDVTAPAAVSDLATSNVTSTSINVDWTAPGDDNTTGTASSYELRRSTSVINSGNFASATLITPIFTPGVAGTAQSKRVANLTPSTTYYFALKTKDEVPNTSAISNVVSATTLGTPDVTAPATINNLTVASLTSTTVTLTWTAPGDDGSVGTCTSYDLRYSTVPITSELVFVGAPAVVNEPTPSIAGSLETCTVSGLNPNTLYYFAVMALDEVPNASGLSNVPSTTTSQPADTTPPAAIANLTQIDANGNTLTMNWTAPGDDGNIGTATSYDLRYSTSLVTLTNWTGATQATLEPTPQAAGTTQQFTASGLAPSTTYYFGIKTADEVGNVSALSNVLTAVTAAETVAPAAITDLRITGRTGNSLSMAWTEVGDDGTTGQATSHALRYSLSPTAVLGRIPNLANGSTWSPANSPYTDGNFAQAVGGWTIGGPSNSQPYQPSDAATKLLGQPLSILHCIPGGSFPLTAGYAACLSAVLGGTYQFTTANNVWTSPTVVTDPSIPLGSFGTPTSVGAIVSGYAWRSFTNCTVYVNLSTTAINSSVPGGSLPPSGYRVTGAPGSATRATGTFPQYGGLFMANITGTAMAGLKDWTTIAFYEANLNGPTDGNTHIPTLPADRVSMIRALADHPIRMSAQVNMFWIFVSATTHLPSDYWPMQKKMFYKANRLNAWIYDSDGVTPHETANTNGSGNVRYIDFTNTPFRSWLAAYTDSMMVATGVDFLFMDQIEATYAAEKGYAPGALWPTDVAGLAAMQDFFVRLQQFKNPDGSSIAQPSTAAGPTPVTPGQTHGYKLPSLASRTRYFVAMTTSDEVPNVSGLSNVVSDTTYVLDTTAPATTSTLAAGTPTQTTLTVTWTAPGDDNTTGTATSYDLRYSTATINSGNFAAATAVPTSAPQVAGSSESVVVSGLLAGTQYYFALKTTDEDGNVSGLSNVPNATTSSALANVGPLYTAFNTYCLANFGALTEPLVGTTYGTVAEVPAGGWVYPSKNSASIAVETTIPSKVYIEYGTTTGYGTSTTVQDRFYYQHLMHITGLTASTTYHYKVHWTDEAGNVGASSDRTFATVSGSGWVNVNGLSGPPYVLSTPGATYYLTANIAADTRAISFQANGAVLDLNGFTITYDNNTPVVAGGSVDFSIYLYSNTSTAGVQSFLWGSNNTGTIVNGTIVQGANNGRGSISSGEGLGFNPIITNEGSFEVAGITAKWKGDDVGGIQIQNGTGHVHHCDLIDSGDVTTHRGQGLKTIFVSNIATGGIHHNLIRRSRDQGIMTRYGVGSVNNNEIYTDSYVTNSYAIGSATDVSYNHLFGTGYHYVGIGFLRDGAASKFTMRAHHNFIHGQGEAPTLRDLEYNYDSSVIGVRLTQYQNAAEPYINWEYDHNVIVVKARNHTLSVRGTQFAADPAISGLRFHDNTVKCEIQDSNTRGACVVGEGDDVNNAAGTENPVYYENNTFISNDVLVRFGERYGSGGNCQFRNNTFTKLGSRTQFVPIRIGYGDFASYRNRFIDNTLGSGVVLAPALWQGSVDLTVRGPSPDQTIENGVDNAPAGRRDYAIGHSWYITALGVGAVPLANTTINVVDSRGASYTTTTNASGVARLELLSDTYEALAGVGTPTHFTHTGHLLTVAGYTSHVVSGGEFAVSNNSGSPTTIQF